MPKYVLPLIMAALFLSFFRLGLVQLFDVDEAVFSAATKEMVQTRNWITPTYNGENRYDKPIFFYWLMALSYKVFGVNNFSARFPSALAAVCLASALFFFVRHHQGEERAFHTAAAFILSIYFLVYARSAVTDMTLTLFISIALFSFYLSRMEAFYAFSALAFLTKGLIGIVFPFGIALIYLCATDGMAGVRKIISLKGIAIFLVLSVPWYAAQVSINGREFIDQFFIKHHFKRYSGVISGHSGPLYFYIPALIIGLFPWVAFLPAGIGAVFRRKDRLDLFAFIWAAFIVAFFSFSGTKLPNYILPAIPAAVILISAGMDTGKKGWDRFAYLFMALLALLFCSALVVARTYLAGFGIPEDGWLFIAGAVMAAIAVADLHAVIGNKNINSILYCLMGLFITVMIVKALPVAGEYLQGALYRYSLYAKETLPPDERIITYGINKPSIVFYSGHKIIRAGNENYLKTLMYNRRHSLVIARTKDTRLIETLGCHVLESDDGYALFEKK